MLLDTGSHGLDTLLWLFGPMGALEYRDDSLGGVESNAEIDLSFENGVTGRFSLSRTHQKPNELTVYCERGWARVGVYETRLLTLSQNAFDHSNEQKTVEMACCRQSFSGLMAMRDQLADVISSIIDERPPNVTGEDGLRVVEVIERCYSRRAQKSLPTRAPLPGALR